MFRKLTLILFMFLPSRLKVIILRICGHEIGRELKLDFHISILPK